MIAKEALLWNSDGSGGDSVQCGLCAHRCRILSGKYGRCAVRFNRNGVLNTRVYGRVVAMNVDPIEKKPLYHFLPASETFSVAAVGCNFRCGFCQNHSISQAAEFVDTDNGVNGNIDINDNAGQGDDLYGGTVMSPLDIVNTALKYKCPSVSFTYTEPTVFFEYALDTAKAAKAAGLKTVFVSNGFMTGECLTTAAPYLDACNIDLKSFREDFYKKQCGASLSPVLESLKTIREAGIWLEVTTLLIGGLNDSDGELTDIARFIVNNLGADTPWHVSGFYPRYRMLNVPPTNAASIERACGIGVAAGLRYVYGGNVNLFQDTRCPKCGGVLTGRFGYKTKIMGLTAGGVCGGCGERICGVF
ncbi:MAG: AmmeMemoRadiSam system radical SAM enzyme [Chitinispirillales bacterium]|jgi:pyruvate formate lyase activating enzyme|nr:AmmeMemoRadiSam system radical SAM enzyme [Chitinispirillales bacterium]